MSSSGSETKSKRTKHSIAVVARRTGISQLLLRAWERRYEAVVPERTPTGRRLYSDQDLTKLGLLRLLTEADHRIGDIAGLTIPELEELASHVTPAAHPSPRPIDVDAAPNLLLGEALEAVAALDPTRLEHVLRRASVALSRPILRQAVVHPLLVEIGERWRDGRLRIAHEHMATAIVRTFLTGLGANQQTQAGAPTMVAATPAGQMHELGLLMASTHAEELGWNVVYLGVNLPAEELAAVVLERAATAILLSLVYPRHDVGTADQLRVLRQIIGPDVAILVGGGAADSYHEVLTEIKAHIVVDPESLDRILRAYS